MTSRAPCERTHRQASKRTPEPWTTEPTSRDRLPSADASDVHGGSLGGGECQDYKHTRKMSVKDFFQDLAPSSRKP